MSDKTDDRSGERENSESGGEEEVPRGFDASGTIRLDCPCIRCGYNLRGLTDDVNCPECGCSVSRTLGVVEARTLCPGCLAPNHPSVSNCEKCGSPLQGAGATANYFRGGSGAGNTSSRPNITSLALIWLFIGGPAVFSSLRLASFVYTLFTDPSSLDSRDYAVAMAMVVVAFIFGSILFLITRGYLRRLKDAEIQEAKEKEKEKEEEEEEEAEADRKRLE